MDDPLTQQLLDAMCMNDMESEWSLNRRLGRFSPNNRKPRPVLIGIPSIEEKRNFLQLSKQLRESGLRLDDLLTERQQ